MTRGPTPQQIRGATGSKTVPRPKARKKGKERMLYPYAVSKSRKATKEKPTWTQILSTFRAMRTALNIVETRCREVRTILPAIDDLKKKVTALQIKAQSPPDHAVISVKELHDASNGETTSHSELADSIKKMDERVRAGERRWQEFDNICREVREIMSQVQALVPPDR